MQADSLPSMTRKVLQTAFNWTVQHNASIIVMASTTGKTALEMMEIIGHSSVKLIVMAHDPRRTGRGFLFSPAIIKRLQDSGHTFINDYAPMLPSLSVSRLFEMTFKISYLSRDEKEWIQEYGIGGKVCCLLAKKVYKAGLIQINQTYVFIGGSRTGADTALALKIIKLNRRMFPEVVAKIYLKN
jgi:hypothetical protein